jgi:electron-transferring-flavoprotein dehydrogenase
MDKETLEVDVLIVGGGPAGLSAALRLALLQKQQGGEPLSIAVLEKAREAGAHMLSGAVLDPSTLRELIPDFKEKGAPLAADVHEDHVYFLTAKSKLPFPVIPPPLRNHGNYIISLSQFVRWLTAQVEAEGIDIFAGFSAQDVLMDGTRVLGVRTGDRGIGKQGDQKPTFEPGVDIVAKVTIFCDGVRGNLTKVLLRRLELGKDRQPQQFAVGLKELWEIPRDRLEAGTVIHTLGYPLRQDEFGGAFIYAMPEGQVSLGFVAGLDYHDPLFDPHMAFNRFKQHPFVSALLEGGTMVRYGAKALPEGGWNTIPRTYMDGGLIAGDAGGFLNSMRLKGIHLAMRTGMLAAETAFDAVRAGDTSAAVLKRYQDRIDASPVRAELYPVRNVHQAFGYGLFAGLLFSGASLLTRGWWPQDLQGHAGHERMRRLDSYHGDGSRRPSGLRDLQPSNATPVDRRLTFDKVTNVHYSGTSHDEDQPSHLLVHTEVCSSICGPEYGHPCTRFCPANVYEIVRDADGTPRLQINASNCVHCKTCDIMDPYAVITWVPPEGGGGPQYNGM